MFGLEPFGLSQLPGPGFPSPQNIFSSIVPQGPYPYNPALPFQQFGPPLVTSFQHHSVMANPVSQVFGSGFDVSEIV